MSSRCRTDLDFDWRLGATELLQARSQLENRQPKAFLQAGQVSKFGSRVSIDSSGSRLSERPMFKIQDWALPSGLEFARLDIRPGSGQPRSLSAEGVNAVTCVNTWIDFCALRCIAYLGLGEKGRSIATSDLCIGDEDGVSTSRYRLL